MWHMFISTVFHQRETCSKRSKFQKVAVLLGRGLPMHQYGNRAVNRQPSFRTGDSWSASSSHTPHIFVLIKFQNFYFFDIFLKFIIFQNFPKFRDIIGLVVELCFSHFMTSILICNMHSTRFSMHFSKGHRAKPCQLDHLGVVVHHFVRAQVCPA